MKINWTVRLKNKAFWLSFVPAVLILIQVVANVFGFALELSEVGTKIKAVVDAIFVILALLGVVNDPTTVGVSDSERALTYTEPH